MGAVASSPGVLPSAGAPERPSDLPPGSGLTAAMLIPRPSQPALAGRPTDPAAAPDPLRERLAQVEVQSAATRSIAARVETEAARAHQRLDAADARVATLETTTKERLGAIEGALDESRRSLETRLAELGERPTAPMLEDPGEIATLRTAVGTLRAQLGEHDRQFEARRARVESVESRLAALDPRLVDLRRAVEGFDLRLVALERAQEALRADVDARLRALEASAAAAPAKKAAAPEPELRRIKGIGPKYEKALREAGITTLAQVAAMTDDDLARIAGLLAVPVERVRKLGWPEAARALSTEAP